jgi:glutamyl-tRNA synthetase
MHLGHARTFWIAQLRAQEAGGELVYRCEDLDTARCKPVFAEAAVEDLRWFGCSWSEGTDIGGPFAPYRQIERMPFFLNAWKILKEAGVIYPCDRSRKDVADAIRAPHENLKNREPVYPKQLRPPEGTGRTATSPGNTNWRFRVPDHRKIEFEDTNAGLRSFVCQHDFGDFPVWRKDGFPAYELAVVVDDAAMQISEVVRGRDLLLSTARQLLIYEALGLNPPQFHHVPLVCDSSGKRLAKRHRSLSLRELRAAGHTPETLRNSEEWLSAF